MRSFSNTLSVSRENQVPSAIAHCALRIESQEGRLEKGLPARQCAMWNWQLAMNSVDRYSTTTRSVAPRSKVFGMRVPPPHSGGEKRSLTSQLSNRLRLLWGIGRKVCFRKFPRKYDLWLAYSQTDYDPTIGATGAAIAH